MIFEKNPFTTAVSIPKSFHLTPPSPTLKNIDQPYYHIHVYIIQAASGLSTVNVINHPKIKIEIRLTVHLTENYTLVMNI